MSEVELHFVAGAVSAEDVESCVSSILMELANPQSESSAMAAAAGLSPAELAGAQARATQNAKGFGPVLIIITISTAVAAHIVEQFWDDVVWPRLKAKLGADSLGERESKK